VHLTDRTQLKAYKKDYGRGGKLGGDSYNIMKMTRTERAAAAYDGKDQGPSG